MTQMRMTQERKAHLEADIVPVFAGAAVQGVDDPLEPGPLAGVVLVVLHSVQHASTDSHLVR